MSHVKKQMLMSFYQTPGVYTEEIAMLPPSVAVVETAIPAFIGYTQRANRGSKSLHLEPTRISSFLEYQDLFGGAPTIVPAQIDLDANLQTLDSSKLTNGNYRLYDSVYLFFSNGGGDCYIVSSGRYADDVVIGDASVIKLSDKTAGKNIPFGLIEGLLAAAKVDQPTLLVCPETNSLGTAAEAGSWQQQALLQAQNLADRFVVLDVFYDKNKTTAEMAADFRQNVGMNALSYGAAYYPWVQTNLTKNFRYRHINKTLKMSGNTASFAGLVTDVDTLDKVKELDKVIADIDKMKTEINDVSFLDNKSFEEVFLSKYAALILNTNTDADKKTALEGLFSFLFKPFKLVEKWTNGANPSDQITSGRLKTTLQSLIGSTLNKIVKQLVNYNEEAKADLTVPQVAVSYGVKADWTAATWGTDTFDGTKYLASDYAKVFTNYAGITASSVSLRRIANDVSTALRLIVQTADTTEQKLEETVTPLIPFYAGIIQKLQAQATLLPPSAVIAGVMAYVDRTRGVWKAPANVSVSGVVGLAHEMDDKEQAHYNVDPDAGKSINVIRKFTGKGFLVWGARTLAGNDNEWRFVPVRRFFNFVEESLKKSTSWAVFEPNDANTWLKVRSQIEGFLNNLWRQGALMGIKPEHAYKVFVGLNVTMKPLDVLEGRLIVEIYLAAVRPAEFIVLRFMHKLPES